MSRFLQSINVTTTENGALTYASTGSEHLDFYFSIAGMRHRDEQEVLEKFRPALKSDPELALKLMFYLRDVRGGQGERKVFRDLLIFVRKEHPDWITTDFVYWVAEYGRWDDVFVLLGTKNDSIIIKIIDDELKKENGLLAKWMPREKSAKRTLARQLMRKLGLGSKEYRKLLSSLTKVVEQQMCAKEWDEIEFGTVPSVAHLRYRRCFSKLPSYSEYLERVVRGQDKINASTLYPHDIVSQMMYEYTLFDEMDDEMDGTRELAELTLEAQWKALPNYLSKSEGYRLLPLVDVSGSMYTGNVPSAIHVAIGMGIYVAERNEGAFKDHFVTFSARPQLCRLEGNTLRDKLDNLSGADWGMNTNFEAVFDLILNRAVAKKLPPEELPTHILVLSDMHFDEASYENRALFEVVREKYALAGYECPQIIFWNLNAFGSNHPVEQHETGAALVSGYSPSLLEAIFAGDFSELTPHKIMMEVLGSERYARIKVPA